MAVATGIVGDALVRAVLAALDVSAERGGATGLDRRHDLQLGEAHVTGVGLSPRRPMSAKDVGDALIFVLIEVAGVAAIWLANGPLMAAAGAFLAGFGYALVCPGLGVEAVRGAPPESRGLTMGLYTVFLDVAMGLGSPALGPIAGWTGLGAVFLVSAIVVLCAGVVVLRILRAPALA